MAYVVITMPLAVSRLKGLDTFFTFYAEGYKDIVQILFDSTYPNPISKIVSDYDNSAECMVSYRTEGLTYSDLAEIYANMIIIPIIDELNRLGIDIERCEFIRWIDDGSFAIRVI